MILTVNRGPSRPEGTFGKAVLDDGTTYACLELPWKDNMPGLSCIAIGMYNAVVTMSPHLGMDTYELQSVPARSDIRIHIGNYGGDTTAGLRSDILGCILLGTSTGILTPEGHAPQKAILGSGAAFHDFMARTGGKPIQVNIVAFDTPYLPAGK